LGSHREFLSKPADWMKPGAVCVAEKSQSKHLPLLLASRHPMHSEGLSPGAFGLRPVSINELLVILTADKEVQ
jgi:hypothetical protein